MGTGSIAEEHVHAFRRIGGIQFDTVVSRLQENAEKFAEMNGFLGSVLDLHDALKSDSFDTVVICSPSDLHAKQAEESLMAGKNVLVEIPISTNYVDAERVARLADDSKNILMVGHTQRFYEPLMEARRKIEDGSFHLCHFTAVWHFLRRQNVNWKGKPRSWTDNLLWHHGCHAVDTALSLLGVKDAQVSGRMGNLSKSLDIPLDLNIVMRTERGCLATISMSYNSNWPIFEYILVGEEDTLIFRNNRLENQNGIMCQSSENPVFLQDKEFVDAVKEKRQASINAMAVLPVMNILQRIQDMNPGIGFSSSEH